MPRPPPVCAAYRFDIQRTLIRQRAFVGGHAEPPHFVEHASVVAWCGRRRSGHVGSIAALQCTLDVGAVTCPGCLRALANDAVETMKAWTAAMREEDW